MGPIRGIAHTFTGKAAIKPGTVKTILNANLPVNYNRFYVRMAEAFGGVEHAMNIRNYNVARRGTLDTLRERRSEIDRNIASLQRQPAANQEQAARINDAIRELEAERQQIGEAIREHGLMNAVSYNVKEGIKMLNSGDAAQIATKWGMVGAAYFGAMGAIRFASGGSFAYNSRGERDIMGIPFI